MPTPSAAFDSTLSCRAIAGRISHGQASRSRWRGQEHVQHQYMVLCILPKAVYYNTMMFTLLLSFEMWNAAALEGTQRHWLWALCLKPEGWRVPHAPPAMRRARGAPAPLSLLFPCIWPSWLHDKYPVSLLYLATN